MLVWFTNMVGEERFGKLLRPRLTAGHWQRARRLYGDYGCFLSHLLTNLLLWAVDRDKVEPVLDELESYWQENDVGLQGQEPELRGLTPGWLDSFHRIMTEPVVDRRITQHFLNQIWVKILGFDPVEGGDIWHSKNGC